MAVLDILKTIKPDLFGVDRNGDLVMRKKNMSGLVFERYVDGKWNYTLVSSAQVLALNATPITVMPAAPAGYAWVNVFLSVHKPAGTAYAGIAAGENLCVKYTNGSGAQLTAVINSTGFLDQTTVQQRQVGPIAQVGTTTGGDYAPVAAAALVLQILSGEITTGNSPLHVYVKADLIKVAFTK